MFEKRQLVSSQYWGFFVRCTLGGLCYFKVKILTFVVVRVHYRRKQNVPNKNFMLMPWKGNVQNSCADRSELCQRWSGTLPNALPSMVGQHSAETFLAYRQCSRKTNLGMCSPPARLSKIAVCLNSPWKWNCLIGDQWTFNIVHAPFSPHQTSLATLDSNLIKVALVFSSH